MSKIDTSLIKVMQRDIYKLTNSCNENNDICSIYRIQESINNSDVLLYDENNDILCIKHQSTSTVERVIRGKTVNIYYYYGYTSNMGQNTFTNCNNACQQGIFQLHANIIMQYIMYAINYAYMFKYIKHSICNVNHYYIKFTFKVL